MSLEFVVINNDGKEIDWVDPVETIRETKHYWFVTNGTRSLIYGTLNKYRFWKYDNYQYIQRELKGNQ